MKKVFIASVATMLIMGGVSQAMASFEAKHLIMSVYDTNNATEVGVDLGDITTMDLSKKATLATGLDFSDYTFDFSTDNKTGVGLWANLSTGVSNLTGYIGITGPTTSNLGAYGAKTAAQNFDGADKSIRAAYAQADSNDAGMDQNDGMGKILPTATASYIKKMNLNSTISTARYQGVRATAGFEAEYPDTADYVDMYLYKFAVTSANVLYTVGDTYQAVIRLTADGDVLLNPNTAPVVPVPGAALLFGSALLGLAGLRRRQNS